MGRRPSHAASPKRRVPAAPRPPGRRGAPVVWLCAAALVLLGSLAYANSLDGVFVIDDFYTIVDNPDIRTPWSASLVRSSWGESAVLGRPLTALTFSINYALHGLDVRGYHVGNIAVHLLCALTLFGLIRRVRQSVVFAFVCASLWMLHPLNSEVVNYISQRTESMMALFYLLTIYASVRAHAACTRLAMDDGRRGGQRPRACCRSSRWSRSRWRSCWWTIRSSSTPSGRRFAAAGVFTSP